MAPRSLFPNKRPLYYAGEEKIQLRFLIATPGPMEIILLLEKTDAFFLSCVKFDYGRKEEKKIRERLTRRVIPKLPNFFLGGQRWTVRITDASFDEHREVICLEFNALIVMLSPKYRVMAFLRLIKHTGP